MSDLDPIRLVPRDARAQSGAAQTSSSPPAPTQVSFDRGELNALLNLYFKMVAAGEWRDYAIDFLKEQAVFSVFRRSSEAPLYRIEKTPKLARRQGAYAVVSNAGLVLKRGHELGRVLAVLEKSQLKLVTG